jgi:hypothetical protein
MKLLLLAIVVLFSAKLFAADEAATPVPPARVRADLMQRSRTIGGTKGHVFAIVREDGALLTGFAFHVGNYEGNTVVQAVQPIFTTAEGKVRGPMLGTPVGAEIAVEAREGYAVAGVAGRGGHVLDGLEVRFMRIKFRRAAPDPALDPADAYASDWIGGLGGDPETLIGGDGRPVVGIFGQASVNFEALGVVQAQPAFFDPAARATAPAGEPSRGSASIRLRRAYELALREELEQTNARRLGARAAYLVALDRYAAQPHNDETATALDSMRAHLRGHEAIGMSLPATAPAAWRELHRAFIAELDKARLERESNIERPLSTYLAQLRAELVRLEKAGDSAAADELRASFRAHPADALTRGGVELTAIAGHQSGTLFLDLGEKGALLVGFEYRVSNGNGRIIGMIQPVYRTKDGTSVGESYGESRGEAVRIEAGEGYAVGAINVKNGDRVDGFEIVFMRVKAGGASLDKTDTYKSDWCGGTGGGGPRTLGGDGRPVIGICGRFGAEIDGIGLVQKAQRAE